MLTITIPEAEYYDERTGSFQVFNKGGTTITIEHSLASISKWEAIYKKAFIGQPGIKVKRTDDEVLTYVEIMSGTELSDEVRAALKACPDALQKIKDYIDDRHCATWFNEKNRGGKIDRRTITAEVIYDWMMSLNIWPECQYWHLNRLLTLIRVRSISQNPNKKKMNSKQVMRDNAALNAARHAQLGV